MKKGRTELLYYLDVYQKSAKAQVLEVQHDAQGTWLCSDQTIFYPGGGGQLPDRGTIQNYSIEDIRSADDGIWHSVPGFSGTVGQTVQMELDWERRHYMMQQHSGQHLISHVAMDHDLKTVSVHLGEDYTMIEFDGPFPDAKQLCEIEYKTNLIIRQHKAMRVHWADKDNIHKFPLRRPAGNFEKLRVLEIEDHDFSACGGTHVANTAEVGLIKVLGVEKIRNHARIKFLIGDRAYESFSILQEICDNLRRQLQADPEQITDRVTDLLDNLQDTRDRAGYYRDAYLKAKAAQLCADSNQDIVFKRLDEGFADDAIYLAKDIANEHLQPAFIVSGERFYFIVPKGKNIDAGRFLKEHGPEFSMRGGGPPDFVQGLIHSSEDKSLEKELIQFIAEVKNDRN